VGYSKTDRPTATEAGGTNGYTRVIDGAAQVPLTRRKPLLISSARSRLFLMTRVKGFRIAALRQASEVAASKAFRGDVALPDTKGLGSGIELVTNDAGHGGSEDVPSLRRLVLAKRRK
jgi:hypothetical protein